MAALIKKMVALTPPQIEWLQTEAARLGIGWAELLRRIVDAAREGKT